MFRNLLFSFFTILIFGTTIHAQQLISYELIRTEQAAVLNTLLPALIQSIAPNFPLPLDSVLTVINAQYPADLYKVLYTTTHPVLGEIQASGAVAIPQIEGACNFPLAVYQHGTTFSRLAVPSQNSLEINFGSMLAADGYVVVMPDYMGLGESEGMHPYVHGPTQALAAIDLMRATRELQSTLDFQLSGQNFVFGYSQGGHAAMALAHDLENVYNDEFELTAAAPMSGPYDIDESQSDVMWVDYATPQYLPYTVIGYQAVYPNLKENFNDIFKEEWGALNNFDGDMDDFSDIMNSLTIPSIAATIFKDDVLEEYTNNPNHPLRVALRENDYTDWLPQAPITIMGCCDDEQVMINNLYVARDKMAENGIENFTAIDWCDEYPDYEQFGHNGCIPFCLVKGKNFFDGLRADCDFIASNENIEFTTKSTTVSPNPSTGIFQVEWDEANGIIQEIEVFNVNGQRVAFLQTNQAQVDISPLKAGIYFVRIQGTKQTAQAKVVKF